MTNSKALATLVTGHIRLFSTSVIYSNFSFLLITKIPGNSARQKNLNLNLNQKMRQLGLDKIYGHYVVPGNPETLLPL